MEEESLLCCFPAEKCKDDYTEEEWAKHVEAIDKECFDFTDPMRSIKKEWAKHVEANSSAK